MMDYNAEWYRAGLISIMQGETTARGTDTAWLKADIKAGDILIINGLFMNEIVSVLNSTTLTLKKSFQGEDCLGQEYAIIPRAAVVYQAEILNRLAALLDKWGATGDSLETLVQRIVTQTVGSGTGGGITQNQAVLLTKINSRTIWQGLEVEGSEEDDTGSSSGGDSGNSGTSDDPVAVEISGEEFV